jgi:HD-GYP domain-containing protein (c-di-GMP phosphodiesterase class II)
MSEALQAVQARIGRSLLRARAGEDNELPNQVREQGDVLVNLFAGLLKLVRVHDAKNRAFDAPIGEFERTLGRLLELLGPVQLISVEDQVYVNDVRIRLEHKGNIATFLGGCLATHGLGGLTFHAFLDAQSIRAFITALAVKPAKTGSTREALQTQLDESGVVGVELVAPMRWRTAADSTGDNQLHGFAATHGLCLRRIAQAWMAMAAGRTPQLAPVRRAILELIPFCQTHQHEIMVVLADQAQDSYLAHAVHVTVISLLIGTELGLDDSTLADLGVAAIFHDVGILDEQATNGARKHGHAVQGLRHLLRQRGFHPAKIRRLLSTAQHHVGHDVKGRYGEPQSLFARIIHIADDYDTLTRVRGKRPMLSPPATLEHMADATGSQYDPLLFQIFVNRVGRFPPGTLVELDDGRIGVVISGVRLPRWFSKPLVRVVRDAQGVPLAVPETIDLARGANIRRVIGPNSPPVREDP